MKIIRKMKTSISIFMMMILMCVEIIGVITPMRVFAEETKQKKYQYEGYYIQYTVTSEWDNHHNIEIEICNESENVLKNWAVSMDNLGNIDGLWNASISEINEQEVFIQCNPYNNEIGGKNSVRFGYILEGGKDSFPKHIELCNPTKKENTNMDVRLRIISEWEDGFQGELCLEAPLENTISGWEFSFDGNFDIINIWNANLVKEEKITGECDTYVIEHPDWNNTIDAGSEYVIGFVATRRENQPVLSNVHIYSVKEFENNNVESSTEEAPTEEQPTEEPTTGEQPTEESSSEEPPTEETTTVKSPVNEDIDWEDATDTDGDGLPDVYEIYVFHSDINCMDTDGDGIPDGYEVYDLGTNPILSDSDDNGIKDDMEDADGDGLYNRKEYDLGTNPIEADTDFDGLTDLEELEVYGTNPLKMDTDEDGINDGDEIALGLNPMNPTTFGIADREKCIEQMIGADSKLLNQVNSKDNLYQFSVALTASGKADHNLKVDGNSYTNMFASDALIGNAIRIDYEESLLMEKMRLYYQIDESIRKNELDLYEAEEEELNGIKRLNIFWFDEEVNMLFPIKTYHDEANGIVYADMDQTGVFCLLDMEKWLMQLKENSDMDEFDQEILEFDEFNEESLKELATFSNRSMFNARSKTLSDNTPIDIVYIIQTEGSNEELFYRSANNILIHLIKLTNHFSNIRVALLEQRLDGIYCAGKKNELVWYEQPEQLDEIINYVVYNIPYKTSTNMVSRGAEFDVLTSDIAGFRKDSRKFVFYLPTAIHRMPVTSFNDYMNRMKSSGIRYSEVHNVQEAYGSNTAYMKKCMEDTGGKLFFDNYPEDNELSTELYEYIVNTEQKEIVPVYGAVIATGYKKIYLGEPLCSTSNYDKDKDGLTNWEEVNTDLITWNIDGSIELPTLKYCYENYPESTYVKEGLDRFQNKFIEGKPTSDAYKAFNAYMGSIKILPIRSNPCEKDSDGDGYSDKVEVKLYDSNPLKKDMETAFLDYVCVDFGDYTYKGFKKNYSPNIPFNVLRQYEGENQTFGGRQGYFVLDIVKDALREEFPDDNIDEESEKIKDSGCGLIAATDVMLYKDAIKLKQNEIGVYNYKDYYSMVYRLNREEMGVQSYGLFPWDIQFLLDNHNIISRNHNVIKFVNEKEVLFEKVTESIQNDNPIVLTISSRWKSSNNKNPLYYNVEYKEDEPYRIMYENPYGKVDGQVTEKHFVVITGIIRDNVKEKNYIQISSWGEKFYMDFDELMDYVYTFEGVISPKTSMIFIE